jgi:RHS repeat-associated protein
VEQFSQPGNVNQYLLTSLSDKAGNKVTLAYDSLTRISTITDAVGQVTTFAYVNKSSLLIKTVTDPFSRSASFTYCSGTSNCPSGMLASITDVLGIKSTFRYGQTSANGFTNTSFINTLTTPYGSTTFTYGDSSTNSALGSTRFLITTAPSVPTDPLPRVSYVEFNQAQDAGDSTGGVLNSGLIPTGVMTCTNYLNSRNTFIFDANQFANAGGSTAQANGTLNYTLARVIHWLHNPADSNPTSTSRVMESEKQPLENRVWYNYYGQNGSCNSVPPTVAARFFPVTASGTVTNGANNQPTAVGRIVLGSDGMTNVTQVQNFAYNANGNVTQSTDPVGRQLTYGYCTNAAICAIGVDLISTTNTTTVNNVPLNDVLETRSNYVNHLPQTITGANGLSSTFLYNSYGQITQFTDAKQEVTKFIYGTGTPLQMAQLMTIQGPITVAKTQYTYDAVSRVASVTDSAGYEIQYTSYDNADRLLTTLYPDGTTTVRSYMDPVRGQVLLDLNSFTDRLSQTTTYVYDADRELSSVTDFAGDKVVFQYNLAGVMNYLKDPDLNVTTWTLDDESRITQKNYADSSFTQTAYESGSSRVHTFTDALSPAQVTSYTYYGDNSLYSTNYTNASTVYDFYDPAYPRLVKMYDQFSKASNPSTWSTWSYNPVNATLGANQLKSTTRPVAGGTGSDTVAYSYDPLNRVVGMTINGLVTQSVGYDTLGRMTSSANGLDSFTYGYKPTDATARVTSVTSNLGPALSMTYYNTPQDELLHKITATTNSGASTLASFTYTYDSDDRVDTLSRSAPTQQAFTYGYDAANRLTSATIGTGSPQYVYKPDAASNLLTITVPGSNQSYTYSKVNTINPATNSDANGSSLTLGGYAYTWDGANRLFTISNSGAGTSSTLHYDGFGRLVEVVEHSAGTVTADHAYLWCGNSLCLAHDNVAATVSAQYFPQGAIIAGTPYYYITDRLGSVTALVGTNGAIATQYTYDPYGNQTTVSGTVHSDIGYAGYFAHAASGLDFALNRAFNPVYGRWLNRDPIGEGGGVNLYAYVRGNPTTFIDPLGLCPNPQYPDAISQTLGPLDVLAFAQLLGEAAAAGIDAVADFVSGYFSARSAPTVSDLLTPGGSPLGTAGSNATIREVTGNLSDAQSLFNQLSEGGVPATSSSYPGTLVNLPNGGTVGLRTVMTNSPNTAATIDVNIPNVPISKIKFNP